ncbi:MAG: 4Fe-4S dicluster domain-containing protein [Lachnospiraceae bacterium]|nr:4Fe-4S dicluster domain-containing protein [Lachnospiraceae bacterium]
MKDNVNQVDKGICTGCGACFNKCKFDAINMWPDENGFLHPQIDDEKCVDCKMCLMSCPITNPVYKNNKEPKCYALWSDNETRKKSSSGGAFTVLAEAILDKGGIVCGAALKEDNVTVMHKFIEDKNELSLLQGSKYVQSDTLDTYVETEKLLKAGRMVLYSGCPCQIAGLNRFLGREYERLITIDLICHGVSSPRVLQKYIAEKEKKYGKIRNLRFRTKELEEGGWHRSHAMAFDSEKGRVVEERGKCDFLTPFLKSLSIRGGCGSCKFAKLPRQGDITIGDFWGISKYRADLDDDYGTSVVLVNTEKGNIYLQMTKIKCLCLEEVPLEWAVGENRNIIESPWVSGRWSRFYKILDKYPLAKAVDYGINRRFDIGFVGWWYGANYGSVLTNFALHEVLTRVFDKTVLMISWPGTDSFKTDDKSMRFAKKHYEISMKRSIEEYGSLNYFCEKFVLGSDQLWNWYSIKEVGNHFLLDFVNNEKIKIAYGTSFGHSRTFFPEDERLRVAELLQEFDSVSVREQEAVDILYRDFGILSSWVLDPVFLCEKTIYDAVAEKSAYKVEEPYIFVYILNPTEEKKKAIYQVKSLLNKRMVIVIDGQAENKDELAKVMGEEDVLKEVEIETWLRLIMDADFVITDSYHGTCFSIINNRNFISIKNRKRGNSRFISLIQMLELQDRLIDENFEEDQIKDLCGSVVSYEYCMKVLKEERQKSLNWLAQALERPKQPMSYHKLVHNLLRKQDEKICELEKKIDRYLQGQCPSGIVISEEATVKIEEQK